MTQQLTDMHITRVSLVDQGANLRRFAVLKRDEEGPMTDLAGTPADATPTGIAAWLRKAADTILGKPADVAKVTTFADIVAGQELSDALYDSWSTLQDGIWSAIYATDEAGTPLSQDAKADLVGKNLDEFKEYLLAAMSTGIEKSAGSPAEAPSRSVTAIVAKVGRKVSGSRLERLQSAATALNDVIAEVTEVKAEADTAEEEPVEKTELAAIVTEAVTKANEPLIERITKLEDAAKPEGEDAPVTLETLAEAVGKLADRVNGDGDGSGGRTSVVGQDGGEPVKKRSVWAGAF